MPFALNSIYFSMYPDACELLVGTNTPGVPSFRLQVFICGRVFVDVRWVKKEIGERVFVTQHEKKKRKENGIMGE